MATYNSVNAFEPPRSGQFGISGSWADKTSLTVAVADTDVLRLVELPAGIDVSKVVIRTTQLDSNVSPTLTASIGFKAKDGSALAADYASTAATSAVATTAAFANTAGITEYYLNPPYRLEVPAWLAVTMTAEPATGEATGTVYGFVQGIVLGAK